MAKVRIKEKNEKRDSLNRPYSIKHRFERGKEKNKNLKQPN